MKVFKHKKRLYILKGNIAQNIKVELSASFLSQLWIVSIGQKNVLLLHDFIRLIYPSLSLDVNKAKLMEPIQNAALRTV